MYTSVYRLTHAFKILEHKDLTSILFLTRKLDLQVNTATFLSYKLPRDVSPCIVSRSCCELNLTSSKTSLNVFFVVTRHVALHGKYHVCRISSNHDIDITKLVMPKCMSSKSTRSNILYYKPCYLEFADIFQNPLRRDNTHVIHEYFHSKEVTCC